MDEVENQSKQDLIISYLFSSLMIILMTTCIWLSSIIINLEGVVYGPYPFATTLGFLAFFFIMVSILFRNLNNLFDAIGKLNDGEYY